jgi:ATP adenylyltransferase
MENLFAPWRLEFIAGKREDGCIFCKKPAEKERLRENLVLHVGERAFVIMNRYPYNSGHLLVCPLRHTADFASLTAEENAEIGRLLQESCRILTEVYRPEGFNMGMNLGAAAGAGIRDHLHWHIVPRWFGDTNFLPVLGDTRSIPELLVQAHDRLRPSFERLGPPASPHAAPGKGGR